MRKYLFLLTITSLLTFAANAQPTIAAPTPPVRTATNVVSLFSEAYTNVAGTDWFPNWGQTILLQLWIWLKSQLYF